MAAVSFKQGEDQKISVNIVEAGVAVNLSTATNIKALLKVNNVLMKKYALVSETDFGTLELPVSPTNQVDIYVERGESIGFTIGAITLIVLVALPDTDFPEGEKVTEYKFAVGRVCPGEGVNETI